MAWLAAIGSSAGGATATTVATYASVALAAASAIKMGQYQAAAANQAKDMAERNAAAAGVQTAQEIGRMRRLAVLRKGGLRAGFAASGVTMEGTPLDLLEQSAEQAQADVTTLKYLGAQRAKGANVDASLEAARAQNSMNSGYLKAAGTLLSGYKSTTSPTDTEGSAIA